MDLPLTPEPPPLRKDASGAIRVGPTRVTLDIVVGYFERGYSAEAIVEHLPALALADVYATIAYYLRHKDKIWPHVEEGQREAERLRREQHHRSDMRGIRERLLARRRAAE